MALLKKCLAEATGAFAIVFFGCGAVALNQITGGAVTHFGISLVFGVVVTCMVYALGPVSQAHFNPAVTLAFAATRNFSWRMVTPYILAQCAGASVASTLHRITLVPLLVGKTPGGLLNYGVTLPVDDRFTTAVVWEIICTFALVFVIMTAATDSRFPKGFGGLAIGSTVGGLALLAGPICGASMNPARSLGPAIVAGQIQHLGAYLIGPTIGGVLAGVVYQSVAAESVEKAHAGAVEIGSMAEKD